MLFANRHDAHSRRLILSPAEAARQQAARRIKARRARDAASRLLALRRQPLDKELTRTPSKKG